MDIRKIGDWYVVPKINKGEKSVKLLSEYQAYNVLGARLRVAEKHHARKMIRILNAKKKLF